jgi:hypothetical protein
MDSILPYGYVPTHWIQILFCISYIIALATVIPVMFFQYRNITLGVLIIIAFIFQLTGHTSMAVSAFLPGNLPTWAVQHISFAVGKFAARFIVGYSYYTCFRRIAATPTQNAFHFRLVPVMVATAVSFIHRFLIIGFEIAYLFKGLKIDPQYLVIPTIIILISTLGLIAVLIDVVYESKEEIPWYRLAWMTGYYFTLQLVPIFILTQDIYDLVKPLVSYRIEMVDLLCDMGMTNLIVMMLGSQSYEIAHSWCQERPEAIARIEARIKEIIYRRRESRSQILP